MALVFNGSSNVITGLAVGGLPDGSVDSDTLASSVNVIKEVDQWRQTAGHDSNSSYFTSNWARVDTSFAKMGTGMTESSGVFTFPSTGVWEVYFQAAGYEDSNAMRIMAAYIYTTVDNGSNWIDDTTSYQNAFNSSAATYATPSTHKKFDVTNVSTHKVKFRIYAYGSGTATWMGDTTGSYTLAQFVRLGGT